MIELESADIEEETVLVGARLPEPVIGRFDVEIRRALPNRIESAEDDPTIAAQLEVPLAMPVEGTLARNEVQLIGGDNSELELLDGIGHQFFAECPERIERRLTEWLSRPE